MKDQVEVVKQPRRTLASRRVLLLSVVAVAALVVLIAFAMDGIRERILGVGGPRIDTLVILPFANDSKDPKQQPFVGEATALTAVNLGRAGVRVIAQSSTARYRNTSKSLAEIARELNADGVLEGGVLRSGNRVTVRATLTHVPTLRQVWSNTYDVAAHDVDRLQGELVRDIVRAIEARLTPEQEARLTRRRPVDPRAYDASLAGTEPAGRVEALKRAIEIDPSYPRFYEKLAQQHYMRNMFPTLPPKDTFPPAKDAAQKLVSLDPGSPIGYRVLGQVGLEYDWDFAAAESAFKRALEAGPYGPVGRHQYAHFLLAMGRNDEAKAESERAIELDPYNGSLHACVSWHEVAARQYDEAERRATHALSIGAPDQLARLALGWSYQLRGRHGDAIPEFQKAVVGWKDAVFPTAALGHAYAAAGNEAAAREVLARLLARATAEYVSPYEVAVVYAGLGDSDRAFEWLEKAFADRSTFLVYYKMDPRIWILVSDQRFQQLLRRMNFPQAPGSR